MSCRGGSALGCRPARVHSPAFPQRRRVTDLDGHAVTLLIHLHPDRIGFVEFERVINEPETIGHAGSHGCVRLSNWDVVRLAQKVKRGVPVSIH
jgi:hypothetical protein